MKTIEYFYPEYYMKFAKLFKKKWVGVFGILIICMGVGKIMGL